ncbi:hypothetical protein BT63DRAFT_423239 [Microthyrium microscopicum]|uniref:NYN domain-containing protein n=1 Tax=Microthyrium microscopicum TaxID=703497 RepID=A0A6A6UFB4_9PEZI|nr:hypothetical protein BT63DRAFT_423239 [Microthyrium microscopicum]
MPNKIKGALKSPVCDDELNIRIYIDNSNLWLQGQKLSAREKRLKTESDPTWRLDFSKLGSVLTRGFPTSANFEFNLYGSMSSKAGNAILEVMKFQGLNVTTYPRSTWTGMEKLVDVAIATDIVEDALDDYYNGVLSEFVLVSGDKDLYAAVEKVVNRNKRMSVFSWKDSLSNVYKSTDMITVHLLDNLLKEIGYNETCFDTEKSLISPYSIVILDPLPQSDVIDACIQSLKLSSLRHIISPKREGATSNDLIIIPASADKLGHEQLTKAYQEMKKTLGLFNIDVYTYFEYSALHGKKGAIKFELKIFNQFDELKRSEAKNLLPSTEGQDLTDDGFTKVQGEANRFKNRQAAMQSKYQKRCAWGKFCAKSKDNKCTFKHITEDLEYVKLYGNKRAGKKFVLCKWKTCVAQQCLYAHVENNDLICTVCDKTGVGHDMWGCPHYDDE